MKPIYYAMKAETNTNHVAGPYLNGIQLCSRCFGVLVDDRGAAYPIGGIPPSGFLPGPVYKEGNMTAVGRAPDLPDCREIEVEVNFGQRAFSYPAPEGFQ